MASITKRGPYQWRVRVRVKGHPEASRTFEGYQEARDWASKIEADMRRDRYVDNSEAENTTFYEALHRFIQEVVPKAYAHPKKYESLVRGLQRRKISQMSLAALRGKHLSDFIRERENEGASAQSILHDLNLVSRVYEICRKDWGMEGLSNPTKNVTKPKSSKGRTRRLEKGEEEELFRSSSERLKPIIAFALETAMRRGEIALMCWDQVDFQKCFVHLPKTKNGDVRSVPLSPRAVEILESLPRVGNRVFQLNATNITKSFRRALKETDIEDFRFHDLRHEATSRLFEDTDLDVMEIKTITGHRSMQMLARYSHLRAHRLAERLAGAKRGQQI